MLQGTNNDGKVDQGINISDLRNVEIDPDSLDMQEFAYPFERGEGFRQFGMTKREVIAKDIFCTLLGKENPALYDEKSVLNKEEIKDMLDDTFRITDSFLLYSKYRI